MVEREAQVQTFDELCQFVARTLSRFETLETDLFRLSRRLLWRGASPCGVLFSLQGPRAVCLTAIWETDRNTVLFYGSTGQRLGRTTLADSPALPACLLGACA